MVGRADASRSLPRKALELFDKLLALDPDKRPTASQALQDPWLAEVDLRTVPSMNLPTNQDCHEMWSKKNRQERKAGARQIHQVRTFFI